MEAKPKTNLLDVVSLPNNCHFELKTPELSQEVKARLWKKKGNA
jgi:hypothetical protein